MSERDLVNRTHGKPGTYSAGCRCSACREAWRTYALKNRGHRAHRLVRELAAKWVRENHPDVWARFYDEANTEAKKPRR